MKILILGAAGKISKLLIDRMLKETSHSLILYGRNIKDRISLINDNRVELVDGDFLDSKKLEQVMQGVNLVYLNDNQNKFATKNILESMTKSGINRIIVASIMGVYDEVGGEFGRRSEKIVGKKSISEQKESVKVIEKSNINYTILRLSWLTDENKKPYILTQKGDPFMGTHVSRNTVVQLILDIMNDTSDKYFSKSIGVSEDRF